MDEALRRHLALGLFVAAPAFVADEKPLAIEQRARRGLDLPAGIVRPAMDRTLMRRRTSSAE